MSLPARIGPYRIVEKLGEGGMGVVYGAEHVETGEAVALKTIRRLREGLLLSIRREIQALARIRHPGVVRIVAEGVDDGRPWYAMERLEGPTLRAWCWRASGADECTVVGDEADSVDPRDFETMPPPDEPAAGGDPVAAALPLVGGAGVPGGLGRRAALTILRRLCAPLAFLHGEGIVHRDLKPENIVVRHDGTPVIVDFGVASQLAGARRESLIGVQRGAVGTISYAAPEQLCGEGEDARADLYALGCILYELLTGRPPFLGDASAVIRAHVSLPPERPSALLADIPPALDNLVMKLLAKDRRARLGYADDLAKALLKVGAHDDEGEQTATRPYVYRPGFTGRDEVLADLAPVEAKDGPRGGLVLVGGESGVGKTRLVLELARGAADKKKVRILMGECVERGAAPLEAFRKPLQRVADRCRAEGAAEYDRLLGERGRLLARYEPALVGLPGEDAYAEPREMAPKAARERLLRAMSATLAAASEITPLILIIDDLQWADELTVAVLELLLEEGVLNASPLTVVATYRSEAPGAFVERLLDAPGARALDLARLDGESVRRMVGDMLAISPPPEQLSAHLATHSEGNPFFVVEYLRLAVEKELLCRSPVGHWVLSDDAEAFATLPVPGSLRDLVALRFDELPRSTFGVLQRACVLGREFDAAVLAKMYGDEDESTLLRSIDTLLRRHVLEEPEPGTLRFTHDKLREVPYVDLDEARRESLHLEAAYAIESLCAPTDIDSHAAVLAGHYLKTRETAAAVRFLRRAGEHAMDTSALAAAVDHFKDALRQLGDAPQTPECINEQAEICLALYVPLSHLYSAGDTRVLVAIERAAAFAERIASHRHHATAQALLASHHFVHADFRRATRHAAQCETLSETLGDFGLRVRSAFTLAVCRYQVGQLRALVEANGPLLDRLDRDGATCEPYDQIYPPYILAAATSAAANALLGRDSDARRSAERALACGDRSGSTYGLGIAHLFAGWMHSFLGEAHLAREHSVECLRLGDEASLPALQLMGRYALGLAHVQGGAMAEAIDAAEQALQMSERIAYRAFRTDAHWIIADASLARRDWDRAAEACRVGRALVVELGERKLESEFHRIEAEVALARGDLDAANESLRQSEEVCRAMGARVFETRTRLAAERLRDARQRMAG